MAEIIRPIIGLAIDRASYKSVALGTHTNYVP